MSKMSTIVSPHQVAPLALLAKGGEDDGPVEAGDEEAQGGVGVQQEVEQPRGDRRDPPPSPQQGGRGVEQLWKQGQTKFDDLRRGITEDFQRLPKVK